jgi:hypothetical protein
MRRPLAAALRAAAVALVVVSCTGDRATSPRAPANPSFSASETLSQAQAIENLIDALFPGEYYSDDVLVRDGLQKQARDQFDIVKGYVEGDNPSPSKAREVANQLIRFTVRSFEDGLLDDPDGEGVLTRGNGVSMLISMIVQYVSPNGGGGIEVPDDVATRDFAAIVIGDDGSGLIQAPSGFSAVQFPAGALEPGTVVTLTRVFPETAPSVAAASLLPTDRPQVGPYYDIDVASSPTTGLTQPMGPGVVWALCVEATDVSNLRIAKARHDAPGVVIFPRVDPGTLVTCVEPHQASAAPRGDQGLGASALRLASRLVDGVASVFAPTALHAIHLGIGGRSDASTVDTGFSLWGAVVVDYAVDGFYSPVANPGFEKPYAVNRARAGRAIPIKFSLGGDQGLDVFAAGSPSSAPFRCDGTPESTVDETLSAETSALSFDAGTKQYIYVWKTESAWAGTCRRLKLEFADGQVLTAQFNFAR